MGQKGAYSKATLFLDSSSMTSTAKCLTSGRKLRDSLVFRVIMSAPPAVVPTRSRRGPPVGHIVQLCGCVRESQTFLGANQTRYSKRNEEKILNLYSSCFNCHSCYIIFVSS